MSYILDALKKSDQERQKNNGPTLQTIQRPAPTESGALSNALMITCLIVLFSVVLIGGYIFIDGQTLNKILPQASTEVAHEESATLTDKDNVVIESANNSRTQVALESVDNTPAIKKAPKPAVVELWELPDNEQQNIPPMTFSFHVYSENPSRRTIIINKRRVKEGDIISEGLVLEEITQQGLILDWKNSTHRFSINVVENW